MITAEIQTENWQEMKIDEMAYFGSEALQKSNLFIIRSEDFHRSVLQRFWSSLNQFERRKSQRFSRKKDCNSYVLVHGLLRSLLSNPVGLPPDCIKFRCNQFGKPYVNGPGKKIFFNISHCSDISVIGIDQHSDIGVDVEKINENVDYESIISHFFTGNEIAYIHNLKRKSIRRFYELWTRKEALLKALGIGISENLGVDVSGTTDLYIKDLPAGEYNYEKYHLKTLSLKDNYIMSIASGNGSGKINVFRIVK